MRCGLCDTTEGISWKAISPWRHNNIKVNTRCADCSAVRLLGQVLRVNVPQRHLRHHEDQNAPLSAGADRKAAGTTAQQFAATPVSPARYYVAPSPANFANDCGPDIPTLARLHIRPLYSALRACSGFVETSFQAVAQDKKRRAHGLFAQVVSEPVSGAANDRRAAEG